MKKIKALWETFLFGIASVIPVSLVAQNDLGGMDEIQGSDIVVTDQSIRAKILSIVFNLLSYVALVAVIVIVIAGIYLVTSQGEEDRKDKAKKIIIYTIVGIIVIALASLLVAFVISVFD